MPKQPKLTPDQKLAYIALLLFEQWCEKEDAVKRGEEYSLEAQAAIKPILDGIEKIMAS